MDSLSRKWVLDRLVYLKCIWQVICRMKNFVNVFRLPIIVLIERKLNQKFTTDQLTTKYCLKLSILYVVIDVYSFNISFKFLWTKLCKLSRKMSVLKQLLWFDLIWPTTKYDNNERKIKQWCAKMPISLSLSQQ